MLHLDRVYVFLAAAGALQAVSFVLYGADKALAKAGGRRISEKTLLLFIAAGGWLGAIAGMAVFVHKRRKWRFSVRYYLALICGSAVTAALIYAAIRQVS